MLNHTNEDPYAQSAEFYEIMAIPHWDMKRDVLTSALQAAGPVTDPVIDIGAGTGLSTTAIAAAIPDVDIHAVEPSAGMRAALMSRILGSADLINRVTIHPVGLEDIRLPDRIGAAVLFGVAGYLDKPARQQLWADLRTRIAPGAAIVVEVMALDRPMIVPEMVIAQQRIGHRENEVRIAGQPATEDSELWTMRYVVREGDRVIRDFTTEHIWRTVGLAELGEEAAQHGMTFQELHPIIGVMRADQ